MDQRTKTLIIEHIPLFEKLAKRFSGYHVANVDTDRIVCFLMQLPGYDETRITIELLSRIDFLDPQRITALLRSAYAQVEEQIKTKALISSLGSIQDSSAMVCYKLLKDLFDSESSLAATITDVNSLGKSLMSADATGIIFFDDNITSGTQLSDFFTELIEGKPNPELVRQPLTQNEIDKLRATPIRICYAIQLAREAEEKVNEIKHKYGLDLKIFSGRHDFDNYIKFGSPVMHNEQDASLAWQFISSIATYLYQDKNWSEDKLYHRLLGYGNLGRLTVFYYNVPKSFIPIFWKYGHYNGKPWIPLFPETQEQKKIERDKADFDFLVKDLAESWIKSGAGKREPNIHIGLDTTEGLTSEIIVEVPSKRFVEELLKERLIVKKLDYVENKFVSRITDMDQIQDMIENVYEVRRDGLSDQNYERYKTAVDNYNMQLLEHVDQVKEYIHRYATSRTISLLIKNSGSLAATKGILKLMYNSGEVVVDEFEDVPVPKWETSEPYLRDYENNYGHAVIIQSQPFSDIATLLGHKKRDPIEVGIDYTSKYKFERIGHNDSAQKSLSIVKMNALANEVVILYEFNYDEEGETLKGKLIIRFEEKEDVQKVVTEDLLKKIDEFRRKLPTGPFRSRRL